jgi:hypothetical protein
MSLVAPLQEMLAHVGTIAKNTSEFGLALLIEGQEDPLSVEFLLD